MGRIGMSAKFIPTASGPGSLAGAGGGGGGSGGGSLYPFSSHSFTTCGSSGDYGPQLSNCRSSYGTDWVNDTEYFDMDYRGIQKWKIPQTGSYWFDARSGSGRAYSSNNRRGYGGRIQGQFELTQGLWLEIAISQGGWGAGGSAGGTFIILFDGGSTRTPLLVVGGGGGQDGRYSHTNGDWDGGTSGRNASDGYSGGSNGNGGQGPGGNGTAGCGYYTNSNDTRGHYSYLQSGNSPNSNSLRGDYNGGGFGGGGGSTDDQGSGGGGWSGGAGTAENSTGGAGGSYFNTSYGSGRQNQGSQTSTHGVFNLTKL